MKLSIAIPAYNAAKSLERTVQSILAQTFSDFEVLIVNNGSVDNRFEMFEGEALKNEIYRKFIDVGEGAYVWDKVYCNQYDFSQWKEGNFGSYEDLIHNLQLFYPVKKYGYLHKGFYHYEVTPTSVTKNFNVARLGQFSNAAKVKRELVEGYGVAAGDDVVERWIVNDLRNAFITAATVGKTAWSERIANVRAVLGMRELKEDMGELRRDCRGRRLLGLAMRYPSAVTMGVRLLKKLKA